MWHLPIIYLCSGFEPANASLNSDSVILIIVKTFLILYRPTVMYAVELSMNLILNMNVDPYVGEKLFIVTYFNCDLVPFDMKGLLRSYHSSCCLLVLSYAAYVVTQMSIVHVIWRQSLVRLCKKSNSRLQGIYSLEIKSS